MPTLLNNARIVLENEVVEGALSLANGMINDIGTASARTSEDMEGDFLIPGLIDIHTDNAEHHFGPRPGVRWPLPISAALAHDWQMIGAGVTTVLDALSIGDLESGGMRPKLLGAIVDGFDHATSTGTACADHYFHFRFELSDPSLMEVGTPLLDHPRLRLISMMDHTPGQGQWRDLSVYRAHRQKKAGRSWDDRSFETYVSERVAAQKQHVLPARAWTYLQAGSRNLPIASHDDTTIEDVELSLLHGAGISEFPTTIEAADYAHARGMCIAMGAPNVVLGGSHSGNVSALDLFDRGLLDVLASDYVPASLLQAIFILSARGGDLCKAVRMVSANPADLLGMADRGRIAIGRRADLLRVRLVDGVPTIHGLWIAGRQYR